MRCQCFVHDCDNSSFKRGVLLSFHRIPKNNKAKWLAAIGRSPSTDTTNKRVCSEHFKDNDYSSKGSKRILKRNVLPSLNLPRNIRQLATPQAVGPEVVASTSTTGTSPQSISSVFTNNVFECAAAAGTSPASNLSETETTKQFIRDYQPSPTLSEMRRSNLIRNQLLKDKQEKEAKRKLKLSKSAALTGSSTSSPQNLTSVNTSVKKRVIKFMHSYSCSPSLALFAQHSTTQKQKVRNCQLKLGNARKSLKNAKRKVTHLGQILNLLKKNKNMSTHSLNFLESTFSGIPCAVIKRMLLNKKNPKKGTVRTKMPPEIRSFAMTLQYYSSKAYEYVRNTFDLALPAPSTIRSWMSKIDCSPGFTQCSLKALQSRADIFADKHPGKKLMLALMLDEMAIRTEIMVEKHNQTVWGYVDVGADTMLANERELASESLTLMVVGINDNFKLPIAYFLINKMTGEERANIIKESLHHLGTIINVKILSITCDGPQVHFKMMSELGCQITDPENLKVHFQNPVNDSNVRVMFDICHMLKLIRNNWANEGVIKDADGNLIKWEFIEMLHKMQEEDGLYLGNKLRKKHLEFKKSIMKVNLAAQTLSESVADALEFLCKDLELEEFKDVMPTVKFIRTFNGLFDIMNSRNPFGRGMKTPLRQENEFYWRPQLEECLNYVKNLKTVNNRPMYLTQKKTPFLGFLITGKSFLEIYDEEVKQNNLLKYILTYKFSQDHLELFFCSVRSRNGSNNNPNALQFMHTYRRLLMHIDIKNNSGNCLVQDNTGVLDVSSQRPLQITDINKIRCSEANVMELEQKVSLVLPVNLNEYQENVVSYISGSVVKIVKNKITCVSCCEALESCFDEMDTSLKLINRKSKGGLIYPCRSVREVCSKVEKKLQTIMKISGGLPPKDMVIRSLNNEIQSLLLNEKNFSNLNEHCFDYTPYEEHHKKILLELIIKTYANIRINSVCHKINQDISGEKIRKIYSKLILFKHQ